MEDHKGGKEERDSARVAALKDDRALFARFLVVVLSRPEIDLKKASVNSSWLRFHDRSLILMVTFAIVLARAS